MWKERCTLTATVRVNDELHATLRALAAEEHRSIGEVIAAAVRRYEAEQFWAGVAADFERLRANPAAWADYQAELALWDRTAGDGLTQEPPNEPDAETT